MQRAREAGADGVVCIGSALNDADPCECLAREFPGFVNWTSGVHPHDAAQFDSGVHSPRIRGALERGSVAIGECGLDYHYDNSPRAVQRSVFDSQLAIAADSGRPVVVHTRDAEDDTLSMLATAASSAVRGVLHCFTGTRRLAEAALDAGWYISFSGIVTFKAWSGDDIVRLVPADRILAESDSPYLAPIPFRGKRNEPAWVAKTVARLAEVRGISAAELGGQVSVNARRFFGVASGAKHSL